MLSDIVANYNFGHLIFLAVSLGIAFGFEFVNGFHDTANAVATVIYTKSLRPTVAVIWSGIFNFLGVMFGMGAILFLLNLMMGHGVHPESHGPSEFGVAFSIVRLLPVDLLIKIDQAAGLAMVLSLLGAAILWNFGTWYLGLPASSSHTLIGSILGVGVANALLSGHSFSEGVNWGKAEMVGLSLLLSPVLGFGLSAAMLIFAQKTIKDPRLFTAPEGDTPPPLWVRGILIFTCTGVSFAHGSNDGQKGMGLIMLILIGVMPAQFALNMNDNKSNVEATIKAAKDLTQYLPPMEKETAAAEPVSQFTSLVMSKDTDHTAMIAAIEKAHPHQLLAGIISSLEGKSTFGDVPENSRYFIRTMIIELDSALHKLESRLQDDKRKIIDSLRSELVGASVEYVPTWVVVCVALSLGVGTTIGWKRIVVTVGEKIGKSHLTYGQGASAELVAMGTIGLADIGGWPVSTTHVLSSGVAGTMWANKSGIEMSTVKSIAMAWILTLPCSMALAGGFYALCRIFV